MQSTQYVQTKPCCEQTSRQTGLEIYQAIDRQDLKRLERLGLYDMYRDIFAEPPYLEKFSIDDVRDYFNSMAENGGLIFVATQFRKASPEQIVAFTASIPLSEKPAVAQLVSDLVPTDKASYFAEDAVVPERRREGISRNMKKALLVANGNAGFENMVLRTSVDSFKQIAAVKQLGAVRIGNITQDVDSLRLDGTTKPDTRLFFNFDLRKLEFGV